MDGRLSAESAWRLAKALGGSDGRDAPGEGVATVTRVAQDGTVWVHIPGGADETPANGKVLVECEPGQVVSYRTSGGRLDVTGSTSSPSVGRTYVSRRVQQVTEMVDRAREDMEDKITTAGTAISRAAVAGATAAATGIADAARRVAEATSQHFWSDTSGIHVTAVEQDDWEGGTHRQSGPNVLINSVGQLFRDGMTNLLALLPARVLTEAFEGDGETSEFELSEAPVALVSVTVDGVEEPGAEATETGVALPEAPDDGSVVSVTYKASKTTMAVFDGAGNEGGNVIASFGEDGAEIGRAGSSRVAVSDSAVRVFDPSGLAGATVNAGGVVLYRDGVRRAATTANGLNVYDADGSTSVALFGPTSRVGLLNAQRVAVTDNAVNIYDAGNVRRGRVDGNGLTVYQDDGSTRVMQAGVVNVPYGSRGKLGATSPGISLPENGAVVADTNLALGANNSAGASAAMSAGTGGLSRVRQGLVQTSGDTSGGEVYLEATDTTNDRRIYLQMSTASNLAYLQSPLLSVSGRIAAVGHVYGDLMMTPYAGYDGSATAVYIRGYDGDGGNDTQWRLVKSSGAIQYRTYNGTTWGSWTSPYYSSLSDLPTITRAKGGTGVTGRQSANATLTGCTATSMYCWHNGVVGTVTARQARVKVGLASGSSVEIATIPDAYCPASTVYAAATSGNGATNDKGGLMVAVGSSGGVTLYNFSSEALVTTINLYFTLTYAI